MSTASRYLPPNTILIEDDDLPMTMQIGMIGRDGIVLASDRKWSTTWVRSNRAKLQGLRDEHGDSKILLSPTGNLAICCADDMIAAIEVAQKVISDWTPGIDDLACNALKILIEPLCSHQPFQCLIASPPSLLLLVSRESGIDGSLSITRASDRICAGDRTNAAKFWHLRYYDHSLPNSKLSSLAAQLIADAAFLNSGIVGGFDLVVSKGDVFRRVNRTKCDSIAKIALQRSKAVATLIFGEKR